MSAIPFIKMHGAGNDYVYVDGFATPISPTEDLIRRMSDRHTGIGSDGLIVIRPSESADARMEMYNADGSRGKMCGNGIRCVGKYLYESGRARRETIDVETDSGVMRLRLGIRNGRVLEITVDMGRPVLEPREIPMAVEGDRFVERPIQVLDRTFVATAVSMGNPHCVVFLPEPVDTETLHRYGPALERHPHFPDRVNAEFAAVEGKDVLRMRVWERGSGETQACGTGACATAVAAHLTGRSGRATTVRLLGGDLRIEWAGDGPVYMTGPAEESFRGEWPAPRP